MMNLENNIPETYQLIKVTLSAVIAAVLVYGCTGCGANLRTGEIGTSSYWEIKRQTEIHTAKDKRELVSLLNGRK